MEAVPELGVGVAAMGVVTAAGELFRPLFGGRASSASCILMGVAPPTGSSPLPVDLLPRRSDVLRITSSSAGVVRVLSILGGGVA